MFRVGDEVVSVGVSEDNDPDYAARIAYYGSAHAGIVKGTVYRVTEVIVYPRDVGLVLEGIVSRHPTGAFTHRGFRKVERRNDSLSIEAFLTIKPGQFEEPRRAPAKKRERVS